MAAQSTVPPLIINKKRGNGEFDAGEAKRRFTAGDGEAKRRFTAPERSIEEFELLNKIGQGAYGVVYRGRDKKTSEIVAVKKLKDDKELSAETKILSRLNHPSIVDLKHSMISSRRDGGVFLVMEYAENDARSLLETMKLPFSQSEVKCLMQQLVQGVAYLHRNQVLHRDLKTSNLLLNNRGQLKICDFGLACRLNNNNNNAYVQHTETVVTLWYRAPELLLGAKTYSTAVDMWAVGCIMAELLLGQPLFDGMKEVDQLGKIFKLLGTPTETIWPGLSKLKMKMPNFGRSRSSSSNLLRQRFPPASFTAGLPVLTNAGFDLLSRLLTYDPRRRITAEEALNHPWFGEVPLPKSKDFMPTFPPNYVARQQQSNGTGLFGL